MNKKYILASLSGLALACWYLFSSAQQTVDTTVENSHQTTQSPSLKVNSLTAEATIAGSTSAAPNNELATDQPDDSIELAAKVEPNARDENETQPDLRQASALGGTYTINNRQPLSLDSEQNSKPEVNHPVLQQLQYIANQWVFVAGSPTRYQLNIGELFIDPDNDLLSLKASLSNSDFTLSSSGSTLTLSGQPQAESQPAILSISAKDSYHGEDDDAWVTAKLYLPANGLPILASHPLEGTTLYRLETTHNLAGQNTLYEVVYCEAFKLTNHNVYFAAATNKTQCPSDEQLELIGEYEVEGNNIILTSTQSHFDAKQTWTLNKQYPSEQHHEVENYFVSVDSGSHLESYTMQKSKAAMEMRINGVTGQHQFQFEWFDYLLPTNQEEYLITQVGNYIYDKKSSVSGPNGETTDSDLNIQNVNGLNLSCNQIARYYTNGVLAGPGRYGIDIISTNEPSNPNFSVDCLEYTSNGVTGQQSLAFDLNYLPYDEFLAGEVYSYVLKPKPQYASQVEELKLNLIYSEPIGQK
ncbi:hypothetical protein [Vibrio sp. LaRot3]|uniref:hypothetical protein n=1 Tax=Vibrio sp. LaRot3 TaxID=2998829 RepID=UPI0022CE1235|nr:hypothetical protein [Vibrio sp. LaRot3]MDA0150046.1 hypothetical protein [Vibrio sp. LaRot3]